MSNDAQFTSLADAARGMGDAVRAIASIMMTGTTITTRMRAASG